MYVEAVFYNPHDFSKSLIIRLPVDIGSTYTWINRSKLKKLNVKPMVLRRFRTIRGEIIEREVGEAIIKYMGERATTIVVFAEETDAKVLGVCSGRAWLRGRSTMREIRTLKPSRLLT